MRFSPSKVRLIRHVMMVALVAAGFSATRAAEKTNALAIIHADYRQVSEFDPGTLRVFINNRSNNTHPIQQVQFRDLPIPVWGLPKNAPLPVWGLAEKAVEPGEHHDHLPSATDPFEHARVAAASKQVIWAKLEFIGKDNEFIVFRAKLAEKLTRTQNITFVAGDGTVSTVLIHPVPNALTITAVTTSENGHRIYLFLKNHSTERTRITSVELDGAAISDEKIKFTAETLDPGQQCAITISMDQPLQRGSVHLLAVHSSDDHSAVERFRVLPTFPMTTEWGTPPVDAGVDSAAFAVKPDYLTTTTSSNAETSSAQAVNVFECAMHTYKAKLSTSANEIFRRIDLVHAREPQMLTSMHLCRIRPEEGYAKFGETVDILCVNPNVPTSVSRPSHPETAQQTIARIVGYAVQGASPRPVHSVLQTTRLDDAKAYYSPDEFRQIAYTILGSGVKGVLYRHLGWQNTQLAQLNSEIVRLNSEINTLRPWLATAAPWPMEIDHSADTIVYSLLAPDVGILLFVITTGAQKSTVISLPCTSAWEPIDLHRITGSDNVPIEFDKTASSLTCNLPTPHSANAYLLRCCHSSIRSAKTASISPQPTTIR